MEHVLAETAEQLKYFQDLLQPSVVPTVYIGGGTPSLLPADLLTRLFSVIRSFISPGIGEDFEWTVEANPESLNERFLEICLSYGVTRLSLGIQSMQDGLLCNLGRPGDAADNRNALRLVESKWGRRLNLDLLAGIPGQDLGSLRDDLLQAVDARPGHISFYTLTPYSGSSMESQIDVELQDRLWLAGFRQLEKSGYRNYEISNFARPGEECRHNLRYWTLQPYLGVGPGAVSTLLGKEAEVYRLSNPEGLERFLAGREGCWDLQAEHVSKRDFLFETLMMGLRLRSGIPRELFIRRFGGPLEAMIPRLWSEWKDRGLATRISSRYALNRKGRLILNPLLLELAEELEKAAMLTGRSGVSPGPR
jgi:oxygen-independent coproporphyrinogen-3 oxidase